MPVSTAATVLSPASGRERAEHHVDGGPVAGDGGPPSRRQTMASPPPAWGWRAKVRCGRPAHTARGRARAGRRPPPPSPGRRWSAAAAREAAGVAGGHVLGDEHGQRQAARPASTRCTAATPPVEAPIATIGRAGGRTAGERRAGPPPGRAWAPPAPAAGRPAAAFSVAISSSRKLSTEMSAAFGFSMKATAPAESAATVAANPPLRSPRRSPPASGAPS